MLITLFKYFTGYLTIEVSGSHLERFLNLCSFGHILIWNMSVEKEGYRMKMSIPGFKSLLPIVYRTRVHVKIIKKHGLPFILYRNRKRQCFFIGFLLCAVALYIMSLFIWDVYVEGNSRYAKKEIIAYLQEKYKVCGRVKGKLNCSVMEEDLRLSYEDIAWVSIEITGTQMIIHIKETIPINQKVKKQEIGSLIANKDATIHSIITREGTPKVKKGQKVKRGKTLISGRIKLVGDGDEKIGVDYVAADGDIIGKTIESYERKYDMIYYTKVEDEKKKTFFALQLYKKLFCPYEPKMLGEIIMKEKKYPLRLGKSLYLPISLYKRQLVSMKSKKIILSENEAKKKAQKDLDEYLKKKSEKGVEILQNNVKIFIANQTCVAKGELTILEPIGKIKRITRESK